MSINAVTSISADAMASNAVTCRDFRLASQAPARVDKVIKITASHTAIPAGRSSDAGPIDHTQSGMSIA
ncbi:hypothetical protein Aple_034480 [Acrocarpospora pleiomorpha]|uniref:Uncharacterized protein n=1 Tax=Acrocarpospora pleiomorpha TaxID=90975 RepID=A0A5M3XIG9_9ACTN|nr:hypothetical protein Aple_034480 [Acrocarpospora pleiomorpha]